MFFKPQKGKAYDNLPAFAEKTFDTSRWVVSTKYDGNQIFITKTNGRVKMFTSDWKEFYIKVIADEVHKVLGNFVLIGEFMHNCSGKLGDRVNSAILTTYRTNFSKGLTNPETLEIGSLVRVFDMLYYTDALELITKVPYEHRIKSAEYAINDLQYLFPIPRVILTGAEAKIFAKTLAKTGWEGAMCVCPKSFYVAGKRVNNSVKLKYRKTADLRCIDTVEGEGKYVGMIGALVLQDSKGRIVNVGSGLDDIQRRLMPKDFIGRVVEIEYEQIIDTYIQPTFLCIREEKEID